MTIDEGDVMRHGETLAAGSMMTHCVVELQIKVSWDCLLGSDRPIQTWPTARPVVVNRHADAEAKK